jgi:hypothetical protein
MPAARAPREKGGPSGRRGLSGLRAQWAATLGPGRLRELEASLRTMAPHNAFRLDVPGWFGA